MKQHGLLTVKGLKVILAELGQEDAGIEFEGNIQLAIYNDFKLLGLPAELSQRLIGLIVLEVEEKEDRVTISFEEGIKIEIDLRDIAYQGPEAMQLRVPGNPIMVWN